jgi:hypothetical protein
MKSYVICVCLFAEEDNMAIKLGRKLAKSASKMSGENVGLIVSEADMDTQVPMRCLIKDGGVHKSFRSN